METYIPKDLNEYEERVFIGLTTRQMTWGAIALVSGTGFYIITNFVLGVPADISIYGTIAISFCLFWMGWRKWQNTRPYTDKVKAVMAFKRKKELITIDGYNPLKRKENGDVFKQTRKDKKINKQYCREGKKK